MLADKQLPSNAKEGGIIGFDIDNLEIPEFHEESHQIHLRRPLSDAEYEALDQLLDYDIDGDFPEEGKAWDIEGGWHNIWINCGAISEAARAYLLALRA